MVHPGDITMYTHVKTNSQHMFCNVCGIHILHVHPHHSDCVAVNLFCLDPLPLSVSITYVPASVLLGTGNLSSVPGNFSSVPGNFSSTEERSFDSILDYVHSSTPRKRRDSETTVDSSTLSSTSMSSTRTASPTYQITDATTYRTTDVTYRATDATYQTTDATTYRATDATFRATDATFRATDVYSNWNDT